MLLRTSLSSGSKLPERWLYLKYSRKVFSNYNYCSQELVMGRSFRACLAEHFYIERFGVYFDNIFLYIFFFDILQNICCV